MKKVLLIILIFGILGGTIFAIFKFASVSDSSFASSIFGAKRGPVSNQIVFYSVESEQVALSEVLAGNADLFYQALSPESYGSLSESQRNKLEIYSAMSSTWSLVLNPYPNKEPYTVTDELDHTTFNPLAIREIRYAINWLINRQEIVDECLLGSGTAITTAIPLDYKDSYRFYHVANNKNLTATGDERTAASRIDSAMMSASLLPENIGKIDKPHGFWRYNGEDIMITMITDIESSNGKIEACSYIANQLEKVGFRVKRVNGRREIAERVKHSKPEAMDFGIFLETWNTNSDFSEMDEIIGKMYAPFRGNMPGSDFIDSWRYENKVIDDLISSVSTGKNTSEDEYWEKCIKALEEGLNDSVRIFICNVRNNYIANKSRFNKRMDYGIKSGINEWSLRSADVISNNNDQKILKVVYLGSDTNPIPSKWNPIGKDGFSDSSSQAISSIVSDMAVFSSPTELKTLNLVANINESRTNISSSVNPSGILTGDISVPMTALSYDVASKNWISVNMGSSAMIQTTSSIRNNYMWHNGQPISTADYMYASAFKEEWSGKTTEKDKEYDPLYAYYTKPLEMSVIGRAILKNTDITVYSDYAMPQDRERAVATNAALDLRASNLDGNVVLPWEIYEAISQMITEGSKSGTKYSISKKEGYTEIDLLDAQCVADILSKLIELRDFSHLPKSMMNYATIYEIQNRYDASIKFIQKHGHAYISNGPFYISEINEKKTKITLKEMKSYPYRSDYWSKVFRVQMTRIVNIDPPDTAIKGQDLKYEITVNTFVYPDTTYSSAGKDTHVKLMILLANGKVREYVGEYVKSGVFSITIPGKDTANLNSRSYPITISTNVRNEIPAIAMSNLTFY